MANFKKAKTKYANLVSRAFDKFIELYLIKCYLDDKSLKNVSSENFKTFNYNDSEIHRCIKAFQVGKGQDIFENEAVSNLDNVITEWFKVNELINYKNFFLHKRIINKDEFIAFYGDDEKNRKCEYCDISEQEINLLLDQGLIYTKRLRTRGLSMEIDRIEPNKGYVEGNIVLCCYWCNNAKTDEFSAKEFKPIGELIGKTLRKRLK